MQIKKLRSTILVLVGLVLLSTFLLTSFKEYDSFSGFKIICKKAEVNIKGLYILHSCEESRFKIKIEKKEKVCYFSILDRKKIISKVKQF